MIVVECYNDRELVHRMGFRPDQIIHELGRSRALGRVEEETRAIGIVDEDPAARQPRILRNEYEERDTKGSKNKTKVRLLVRKDDSAKAVIQIPSRLENWLYEIAKQSKILPQDFGLPDDPKELHDKASIRHSQKDMQRFQRFLDALRRTGNDEITIIRDWIREAITE
ncbi:hypothetical protein ACFL6S_34010 [Candidatus Poribacteria bacterium]